MTYATTSDQTMYANVKRYRDSIRAAFAEPNMHIKQWKWEQSHFIARCLIIEYGMVTFARLDDIAYRYA